jgi:glycosyltransferase involved in cell wall biosynthesis
MTKRRLLWISDNPYMRTGMGIVTKETINLLKSKYDIAVAAWGCERHQFYQGIKINQDQNRPYTVYSIRKDCYEEKDDVIRAIQDFHPDVILCFGDQWNFGYMGEIYKNFPNIYTGCYTNIDSGPVSHQQAEIFKFFDFVIVSSQFAKNNIKELIPTRKIDIEYHGINHNIFYALNKIKIKQTLGIPENFFNIGYVARNQTRKNIPSFVKIFSEFSKDKNDVLMTLVSDIRDTSHSGADLLNLIRRNVVKEKQNIIITNPSKAITDEKMNLIYNSLDIYLSTSYAEGQGMPLMEAMSAGAIPIVPNAYCMPELIKAGAIIPITGYITLEAERNFACIDEKKAIETLECLYNMFKNNKKEFNGISEMNIQLSFNYNWNKLAKKIDENIENILTEGKDTCITASVFG